VAPEAIEAPADDGVDPSAARVGQELIQRGAAVLGPADAAVDVLGRCPAPRGDVLAELRELILGFLIECADACVDGGLHAGTSAATVPAFRIWSATFSTRWADRSGMGLPAPHHP